MRTIMLAYRDMPLIEYKEKENDYEALEQELTVQCIFGVCDEVKAEASDVIKQC